MTAAPDLIFGVQSEYTLSVDIDGVVYVDRFPRDGGDVQDRLTGGLVFKQEIPRFSENSIRDTLGSMILANTRNAPLTAEFSKTFKGLEYTISVSGVLNKGLINEEIVEFDNRLEFTKGIMNGSNHSENSFQFSFGGNQPALDTDLLDQILKTSDEVNAAEFDFSQVSTTNARSTPEIQVDVVRNFLNDPDDQININFGANVTELEVSLEPVSSNEDLTQFTYADVSATQVQSTGEIESTITLSSQSATTFTITLDFTPCSACAWIIRDIDIESISNWSIAPDSIEPAYGDYVNSVHTWNNLNNVSQITFDVTRPAAGGNISIFVPGYDPQTRPHIFNGNTSIKIWPVFVREQLQYPTGITWSLAPTNPPTGSSNAYSWMIPSPGGAAIGVTATFPGVSGADPLVMSSSGNTVTLKNNVSGMNIVFQRVYKDSASDPSKVASEPLVLGSKLDNYEPLSLGGDSYNAGTINIDQVRDNGTVVPLATSQANYDATGTAIWYQPNPAEKLILIKNTTGTITMDGNFGNGLGEIVKEIVGKGGITFRTTKNGSPFSSISDDVNSLDAAWFYDDQLTIRDALDEVLPDNDVIWYFDESDMFLEFRKSYTITDFDIEINPDGVSGLTMGNDLDRYHKITVFYDKNWKVQNNLVDYKSEFKSVETNLDEIKYSDYPTNTVRSGSIDKELYTSCTNATSANFVLERAIEREKRRQRPFRFYYQNTFGQVKPNRRLKMTTNLAPDGMWLTHKVTLDTRRNRQLVEGVWYADQL